MDAGESSWETEDLRQLRQKLLKLHALLFCWHIPLVWQWMGTVYDAWEQLWQGTKSGSCERNGAVVSSCEWSCVCNVLRGYTLCSLMSNGGGKLNLC